MLTATGAGISSSGGKLLLSAAANSWDRAGRIRTRAGISAPVSAAKETKLQYPRQKPARPPMICAG